MGNVAGTGERRVKKPISVIQCSNPVSLVGRKLFNIFLWKALKTNIGLEKEVYTIDLELLVKYTNLGKNNKNYVTDLIDKTKELQTTTIEWSILENQRKGSSTMIGSAEVKCNVVEYTIPYHLRKLIVESNMFEMIRMNIMKLFKSKYSLALYENCVRYKNVGSTGFIGVDEWRKLLGVPKSMKYETTYNFNHYILKRSMNEINITSDIKITQENKKKGKSISHFKFHIEKKVGIENITNIKDLEKVDMGSEGSVLNLDEREKISLKGKEKIKELRRRLNKDK